MFLAMLGYMLLVLIRPQDYPALGGEAPLPLLPAMLILAAVLWLISLRKRFDAPQYLILLLFFVALMLSNVANGWFGGALEQLGKFAPTVMAFVILANAADSRKRIVVAMATFVLCASVLALHGIGQSQTGVGWTGMHMSQETRIQYVGIFNDPNDLGLLFVMCVPMAAYLASRGGLGKWLWRVALVLLVYGIYLTDSRGTMLALLAVVGVYLWWRRGAVTAGLLAAGALAVLMALPSRMQEMDVSEASAMGRVESWYEGLMMFRQHPLFGVGADMYSELYHLTAHNSFVLVLAETGIIGFTLWIAFVGYCFRMMLAAVRQPPAHVLAAIAGAERDGEQPGGSAGTAGDDAAIRAWYEDRAIALALLLSLCGFFVGAFFLSRSYIVILYLLAALVVAHYTAMRSRDGELPAFGLHQDMLRWPLWSVAGVVGLYLAVKVLLVTST